MEIINEKYKLYQGDCLKVMDKLIKEGIKVDAIITDPPYGTTQNKWDSVIPLDEMWEKINKLIKDNGAIVLFAQDIFSAQLITSNPKMYKYKLFWKKDRPSGFLNAKKMPLKDIEEILIFYKKCPTYNPQFWEGIPLHGMGTKYKEGNLANNNYGKFASHINPSANREGDTKKYPRQLLEFKRPHPAIFPTQKPVDLLEYLIRTYTNENEIVLDFTMGSGSTGVACLITNRNFIGIELDGNYFNVTKDRLKNTRRQKKLF